MVHLPELKLSLCFLLGWDGIGCTCVFNAFCFDLLEVDQDSVYENSPVQAQVQVYSWDNDIKVRVHLISVVMMRSLGQSQPMSSHSIGALRRAVP